jgi:hypothetical protein
MPRLNVRALATVFVAVAGLAAAVYVVHNVQVRRNAPFFLDQARRAQDAGQLKEAVDTFPLYLKYYPEDLDAKEEYAKCLSELILYRGERDLYRQAFETFEELLRQDPDRSDARRQLVKLEVLGRRFGDAMQHLTGFLLKKGEKTEKDAELWLLRGECEEELGDYGGPPKPGADPEGEGAWKSYNLAVKYPPKPPEAYDRLAALLEKHFRDPDRAKQAKTLSDLMDDMVKANPNSPEAYIFRGEYRHRTAIANQDTQMAKTAADDFTNAMKIVKASPADVLPDGKRAMLTATALLRRAQCASQRGMLAKKDAERAERKVQFEEARRDCRDGIDVAPASPSWYLLLADIEVAENAPAKAMRWLNEGLERVPEKAGQWEILRGRTDLLWRKAVILLEAGNVDKAKEIKEIVGEQLDPDVKMEEEKKGLHEKAVDSQTSLALAQGRTEVRAANVFCRARDHYLKGWLAYLGEDDKTAKTAARHFEAACAGLTDDPNLLSNANRWLARCYERQAQAEAEKDRADNLRNAAIAAFRSAVQAAPTAPIPRIELAAALRSAGRDDEADEEERTARQLADENALRIARQEAANSKEYQHHLILAQLLVGRANGASAAKRTDEVKTALDEADKEVRLANQLAPESGITWLALVRFLVEKANLTLSARRTDEAKATFEEAEKELRQAKQKIVALAERASVMTLGYEDVGRRDEAARELEAARAAAAADPALLRLAVEFYLRNGRFSDSQAILEKTVAGSIRIDQKDFSAWARRVLSQVLVRSASEADRQRALALIDQNLALQPNAPEDLRVKAIMLAQDPKPKSSEGAIAIVENLLKDPAATAADRLLLARLHLGAARRHNSNKEEQTQHWQQFLATMAPLVNAPRPDRALLPEYVDALLQREPKGLEEAEKRIGQLERVAADDLATAALRARLLFYQGRHDEAIQRLDDFRKKSDASPNLVALTARIVAILNDFGKSLDFSGKSHADKYLERAQSLVREFADKHAEQGLLLARELALQGSTEDALKLAEQRWPKSEPLVIGAFAAQLVGSGRATPEQLKRLEALLKKSVEKKPEGRLPLLLSTAELYTAQERFDEVEALYREVLSRDAKNIIVLNNWAVLLALRGKDLDQASQMIERAIELPKPETIQPAQREAMLATLLDSRASVAAAQKRLQQAEDDLKKSIAKAAKATTYFHLAQVHLEMGNKRDGATAWSNAQRLQLTREALHPLERPAYDKLKGAFP